MNQTTEKKSHVPCHTCRKHRWKCDRTLPTCLKCTKRRQECLGYQNLLRWHQGMASRGKLTGKTTFEQPDSAREFLRTNATSQVPSDGCLDERTSCQESVPISLTEPYSKGIDTVSRRFLHYFSNDVCKDLVLYDDSHGNPFRDLIAWGIHEPTLLHTMVAVSAQHMLNMTRRSDSRARIKNSPTSNGDREAFINTQLDLQQIALIAKQRALWFLKHSVAHESLATTDTTLAAVLLFIELELLDSGRNDWAYHVKGARSIIKTLYGDRIYTGSDISSLRRTLISNCLIFDIIGSTVSCSDNVRPNDMTWSGTLSLLQDSEGNHCSGFPTQLLSIIQAGAGILSRVCEAKDLTAVVYRDLKANILELLKTTQSFDPSSWAQKLQKNPLTQDVIGRTHLATAHKAAVSIYLSRVLLSFCPEAVLPFNLTALVKEIITELSQIDRKSALFTAVAWPAFIAGAETNDDSWRSWITDAFEDLFNVMPWGTIKAAPGVLESIWDRRREQTPSSDTTAATQPNPDLNWLIDLRNSGVSWLII